MVASRPGSLLIAPYSRMNNFSCTSQRILCTINSGSLKSLCIKKTAKESHSKLSKFSNARRHQRVSQTSRCTFASSTSCRYNETLHRKLVQCQYGPDKQWGYPSEKETSQRSCASVTTSGQTVFISVLTEPISRG